MSKPSLIAVLVLVVAGCSGATPVSLEPAPQPANSSPTTSDEGAGTELELRFDETVEFEDLELTWLELDDSRCPTGVTCIWEGQIVASFEVGQGQAEPVKVELLLRAGHETEPGRAFGRDLRLLGVDPHPKEGQTPERDQYVARLEISEP
jgi:hypothetical protein